VSGTKLSPSALYIGERGKASAVVLILPMIGFAVAGVGVLISSLGGTAHREIYKSMRSKMATCFALAVLRYALNCAEYVAQLEAPQEHTGHIIADASKVEVTKRRRKR